VKRSVDWLAKGTFAGGTGENAYPKTMQPSSARRLACSQARAANSKSTVPPVLPWKSVCEADSQVLTTKLVLASSLYG